LRRGDIISAVISGDYGKPRPVLVVQSDRLVETGSILICPLSSTFIDAPLYRFPVPADEMTGLHVPSQIMVDKLIAVRRDRCGAHIGRVTGAVLIAVGQMIAFVTGIADG